jgi:hypothetical protein
MLKNPSNAQARILQWHQRLMNAEAKAIASERELGRLKDINTINKKNSEANATKLEEVYELLLRTQNEHDNQLLDWEQQQSEFEKTIAQYEEERDRLYLSTTASELKDTLPDRSLPLGEQLENALKKLIERTRQLKFLDMRNKELESKSKEQISAIQVMQD